MHQITVNTNGNAGTITVKFNSQAHGTAASDHLAWLIALYGN